MTHLDQISTNLERINEEIEKVGLGHSAVGPRESLAANWDEDEECYTIGDDWATEEAASVAEAIEIVQQWAAEKTAEAAGVEALGASWTS